jgi:hypothetical protein
MSRRTFVAVVALGVMAGVALPRVRAQSGGGGVPIDADDIGGVVVGARGPEAGVWVIAETTELPTRFVRIVVTDERGRFLVPDLPKAVYDVWVRGYGLVDSPKVKAAPGKVLNLTASHAPNARAAAEYYPASYWYSLMKIPDAGEFPGTGPNGNGIGTTVTTQAEWINQAKTTGCLSCHQLGNKATREISTLLGSFPTSIAAWDYRLQTGPDGADMYGRSARFGRARALATWADWTDRIAAGEVPPAPPRPQGVERNLVVTQWDWSDGRDYFHDAVASDKRNPTINANGLIFGVHEVSSDVFSTLDPVHSIATQLTMPTQPVKPALQTAAEPKPSVYWGDEPLFSTRVNAHSNVIDQKGRVWNTAITRPPANNPAFCKEGSTHPSAKLFPLTTSGRQYSVYDPRTQKWAFVDTCFSTFHLNFAADADNTLWSGSGGVVGWVNTRILDETGDQQKAQGWAPLILDTNGNGKQDAWVEPDAPVDPTKDKRINVSFYATSVSPADGSVWGTLNAFPGALVRVVPGPNPPTTTMAEIFDVPSRSHVPAAGFVPRGADVDANGIVWTVMGSGHLASFDRRRCKGPLNGPSATGPHCREGWTFYLVPGPHFKGSPDNVAADSNYYDWIDVHDTLGMGKNVPVATGNLSDSLLVLINGKWTVLRVPYPLGFFAKQLDGRIDDATTGWKGKGIWTAHANRTPWHLEGGKGTRPKVVKFQVRPNPLAK